MCDFTLMLVMSMLVNAYCVYVCVDSYIFIVFIFRINLQAHLMFYEICIFCTGNKFSSPSIIHVSSIGWIGWEGTWHQLLKKILTSSPILKFLNLVNYFVVCIYVCEYGIRWVLMQNNHVVCYESRKLKEHEKNYSTHD